MVVGTVLALVAIGVLLLGANLGRLVKAGIERFGSQATQTAVTVDDVELSLRSGSGTVRGLNVQNPPAYSGPPAVRFGEISLVVDPASVQADKIVVRSLRVSDGELNLVGGLQDNNLKQIAANVSALAADEKSGKADSATDPAAKKKFQVDELAVSGLKLNMDLDIPVVGKQQASLTLPDFRLANLGTGPEGVTAGELTEALMQAVMKEVLPAVTKNMGKQAEGVLGSDGKKAVEALEKVGNLFKKP